MATYISTYIVTGSEITVVNDGTQPLSQYTANQTYLYVTTGTNNSVRYVIDLSKYLLWEANLNLTQTVSTLATNLTDLQIAGYSSTKIPTVDIATGAFNKRLNVTDAYIASDLTVEYTSLYTPDVRNDLYQRDVLNDLVVSSSTGRSFANSLAAVNGVFHQTYFYQDQLFIQNGFFNVKNSKQNKVVIFDTTSLGGHTIVPIKAANIDASNKNLFSGVTLTFDNIDFSGTTPMLVLGGYLLPPHSAFRLINTNRLIIDTYKLDFVSMFLNDPNTMYTQNNVLTAADTAPALTTPSVADDIVYYLTTVYPTAFATNTNNSTLLEFQAYQSTVPVVITTTDMINYFLTQYPYNSSATNNAALFNYTEYEQPTAIVGSLPVADFTNPLYLYELLQKENTFLVVINNPTVYTREYDLYQTGVPSQYVAYGDDTPRGVMLYNDSMVIPYLTYTEGDQNYHDFSLDYVKTTDEVYKTALNPAAIPSPKLDTKLYKKYPVKLLEFYSP